MQTFAQIIVFWGVFLFVVPPLIGAVERRLDVPGFHPPWGPAAAVALFALASFLGLASAYTMVVQGRGTPLPLSGARRLVVRGPYRWLRNPMAVAGLAQGAAAGLWLGSWFTMAYVIAGGVLWHLLVRPKEEAHLLATFGDDYVAYRAAVPLWIPRLRG